MWTTLIVLGVVLQIALAAYVVSVVAGDKRAAQVAAPAQPDTPSVLSSDREKERYLISLAHDKVIDASEWHVEPTFFRELLRRPNKDLTEFEASHTSDDSVVDCLKGYPINRLVLVDSHITRAALKVVATMEHLQDLEIDAVKPTPDDLDMLMKLPHLSKLRLTNCDLSDQCMAILSKHHFVELVLDRNPGITDAGLSSLAKSPVVSLALGETAITDRGVKQLAKNASLRELLLWRDNISDESLRTFEVMKNLALLDLSYTNITDRGLQDFAPSSLKKLVIRSCSGLTPKMIKNFKNRNPNCYIATENGSVD